MIKNCPCVKSHWVSKLFQFDSLEKKGRKKKEISDNPPKPAQAPQQNAAGKHRLPDPAVEPQASSPGSRGQSHLRAGKGHGWPPPGPMRPQPSSAAMVGASQGLLLAKYTLIPRCMLMRSNTLTWDASDRTASAERSACSCRRDKDIPALTLLLIQAITLSSRKTAENRLP